MTKRNKRRELSVPEQHQLKIARQTLKMHRAVAAVMGGPDHAEAREIIFRLTGERVKYNPKRRKNPNAVFTAAQLARLVEAYSKLDSVDPSKPGYNKLAPYLDGLTQPQLKQLAGAKIKFLSKLAQNRVKHMKNPIRGPGKYEGETYAVRYAHENPDDELGDVQDFGWYGNFSGKIKGRGPFHIITTENNSGFVSGEFYDTEKEMRKNWRRIENEYEEFLGESGEE